MPFGAKVKAHKLPILVAPTEETDYQICKAGMKAVQTVIAESVFRKQESKNRAGLRLYQGMGTRGAEQTKCRLTIVTVHQGI